MKLRFNFVKLKMKQLFLTFVTKMNEDPHKIWLIFLICNLVLSFRIVDTDVNPKGKINKISPPYDVPQRLKKDIIVQTRIQTECHLYT